MSILDALTTAVVPSQPAPDVDDNNGQIGLVNQQTGADRTTPDEWLTQILGETQNHMGEPMFIQAAHQRRQSSNVWRNLDFQKMWDAHPGTERPCTLTDRNGNLLYRNQCSMRMSVALDGAGVNMNAYPGNVCKVEGQPRMARGAQDLANWL
jgi:hypothetical protein